jgi:hypothetical protein
MKMYCARTWAVVTTLELFVWLGAFAESSDLATVKFQYESAIAATHAAEMADRKDLGARYTNVLNTMKLQAQQAGDLDGVKFILDELKRFSNKGTAPDRESTRMDANGGKLGAELPKLFSAMQQNSRTIDVRSAKEVLRLANDYDRSLSEMQTSLTKAGKIEQAIAVQEERKLLVASSDISEAKAALSDELRKNGTTNPDAAKDSKPSPGPEAAPAAAGVSPRPVPAAGGQGPKMLWRIGKCDGYCREFALAPNGYKDFKDDGNFTVGSSSPSKDWPYIHPGPRDAWAGGRKHAFTVHFNVDSMQAGSAALLNLHVMAVFALFPPHLKLELNGRSESVTTTAGNKWRNMEHPDQGSAYVESISFGRGSLKTGENLLIISNEQGSCLVYDALELFQTSEATSHN